MSLLPVALCLTLRLLWASAREPLQNHCNKPILNVLKIHICTIFSRLSNYLNAMNLQGPSKYPALFRVHPFFSGFCGINKETHKINDEKTIILLSFRRGNRRCTMRVMPWILDRCAVKTQSEIQSKAQLVCICEKNIDVTYIYAL